MSTEILLPSSERLDIVTPKELHQMLERVGVRMSLRTIYNNMDKGYIHHEKHVDPLNPKNFSYEISAEEVNRILGLYGKEWPRDQAGQGLLDPVGHLQRKTAGTGPRRVLPE